jgi:nitrite reductase (NADH) small subunit
VVASPLYKQHFDLISGQCLEQPEVVIPVYGVKLQQGRVWLNTIKQVEEASAA